MSFREILEEIKRVNEKLDNLIELSAPKKKIKKTPSHGSKIWDEYARAYEHRYQVLPPRNAQTNAHCKQLLEKVGLDDAIELVHFYLTLNDNLYSHSMHPLVLLVRDYQKIFTRMHKGLSDEPNIRDQRNVAMVRGYFRGEDDGSRQR